MRRYAASMGTLALLIGCVPAVEETDPRGGVDIRIDGTDETLGKPFTTDDGWTITVDAFAVRVSAVAAPRNSGGSSPSRSKIVTGAPGCSMRLTAINLGPVYVGVQPNEPFISEGYSSIEDDDPPCSADPAIIERFNRPADYDQFADYRSSNDGTTAQGPSVVLHAHAEKHGRIERLELALAVTAFSFASLGADREAVVLASKELVTIEANKGASAHFTIDAAGMFRDTSTGALRFERFGAADVDNDGFITGEEVANSEKSCRYADYGEDDSNPTNDLPYGCTSLAQDLSQNATVIFPARP